MDSIYGYIIKALENNGFTKEEIIKIFEEMIKLQETIPKIKAQTYYYDLYN